MFTAFGEVGVTQNESKKYKGSRIHAVGNVAWFSEIVFPRNVNIYPNTMLIVKFSFARKRKLVQTYCLTKAKCKFQLESSFGPPELKVESHLIFYKPRIYQC